MPLDLSDIHSLSDFQRNTRSRLRKLRRSGQPVGLTVNGEAELVVQSAKAYQRMMDDHELVESIRAINRGVERAKRGEGKPVREMLESLAAEHGISLK